MKKHEDITKDALVEMFKRVGLDFTYERIMEFAEGDAEWYYRMSWTKAEEDDFEQWMYYELNERTDWGSKKMEREIGMFMLMWGWKTTELA